MKALRTLAVAAFALGLAATASANTIWNLSNVQWEGPSCGTACLLTNAATGFFEVNSPITGPSALVSWDITVTGTNTAANHNYKSGVLGEGGTFYSASNVAFNGPGFNPFMTLVLASAMTNAGGTINLVRGDGSSGNTSTLVCPGCGLLKSGAVTTAAVPEGTVVPEPLSLGLLGSGLLAIALRLRTRKR